MRLQSRRTRASSSEGDPENRVPATPRGASVSVVTCTYSTARAAQLFNLIEALKAQTVAPAQIIVTVDHNPELLARLRADLSGVTVTENLQPRGLSGSRNSGINLASGDIVAFIDDDAIPAPQWVERLAAGYEEPNVVGVGGAVDPTWEAPVPRWFPAEFGWVVGCGYAGMPLHAAAVRNFIGCNMSFRREVLAGLGGFRLELGRVGMIPVGCEETEFCIRLIRDHPDYVLRFDPGPRVRHLVPGDRMTWAYFRSRCYAEGRSKARVARIVGSSRALASERSYVVRTLTIGVMRNLAEWLRGDWAGLARAAVIVAGLTATTAGYSVGRWQLASGHEQLASPQPDTAPQQ